MEYPEDSLTSQDKKKPIFYFLQFKSWDVKSCPLVTGLDLVSKSSTLSPFHSIYSFPTISSFPKSLRCVTPDLSLPKSILSFRYCICSSPIKPRHARTQTQLEGEELTWKISYLLPIMTRGIGNGSINSRS